MATRPLLFTIDSRGQFVQATPEDIAAATAPVTPEETAAEELRAAKRAFYKAVEAFAVGDPDVTALQEAKVALDEARSRQSQAVANKDDKL